METEKSLEEIFYNLQQILSEDDGRVVQVVCSNGRSRVSFGTSSQKSEAKEQRRLGAAEVRSIDPNSYVQNGFSQQLYSGPQFPISLESEAVWGGNIRVTLRAINSFRYKIIYNNNGGWVSNVQVLDRTLMSGRSDQMAAKTKIHNTIANTKVGKTTDYWPISQVYFRMKGKIRRYEVTK